jgi:hypothetical protein
MIRRAFDFLQKSAVALTGVGLALALSGTAQAVESNPQHRHQHYAHYAPPARNVAPPGDVVVHTGRVIFYPVDPYAEFLAGPHYYVDTALDTDPGLVHPFGHFGEAVLPSRFNPPGQSAPLFTFW